eukprot:jgi/Bigna1/75454/fgenesh1_pg.34_\
MALSFVACKLKDVLGRQREPRLAKNIGDYPLVPAPNRSAGDSPESVLSGASRLIGYQLGQPREREYGCAIWRRRAVAQCPAYAYEPSFGTHRVSRQHEGVGKEREDNEWMTGAPAITTNEKKEGKVKVVLKSTSEEVWVDAYRLRVAKDMREAVLLEWGRISPPNGWPYGVGGTLDHVVTIIHEYWKPCDLPPLEEGCFAQSHFGMGKVLRIFCPGNGSHSSQGTGKMVELLLPFATAYIRADALQLEPLKWKATSSIQGNHDRSKIIARWKARWTEGKTIAKPIFISSSSICIVATEGMWRSGHRGTHRYIDPLFLPNNDAISAGKGGGAAGGGDITWKRPEQLRPIKAYAKAHGGYKNLQGGRIAWVTMRAIDRSSPKEDIWSFLSFHHSQGHLMGLESRSQDDSSYYTAVGLSPSHAYSILDVVSVASEDGLTYRLVKLRNPWGFLEWKGAFNDGSRLWSTLGQKLAAKMNKNSEDGTFWMLLEDVIDYFYTVAACHVDMKATEARFDVQIPHFYSKNRLFHPSIFSLKEGRGAVKEAAMARPSRYDDTHGQNCSANVYVEPYNLTVLFLYYHHHHHHHHHHQQQQQQHACIAIIVISNAISISAAVIIGSSDLDEYSLASGLAAGRVHMWNCADSVFELQLPRVPIDGKVGGKEDDSKASPPPSSPFSYEVTLSCTVPLEDVNIGAIIGWKGPMVHAALVLVDDGDDDISEKRGGGESKSDVKGGKQGKEGAENVARADGFMFTGFSWLKDCLGFATNAASYSTTSSSVELIGSALSHPIDASAPSINNVSFKIRVEGDEWYVVDEDNWREGGSESTNTTETTKKYPVALAKNKRLFVVLDAVWASFPRHHAELNVRINKKVSTRLNRIKRQIQLRREKALKEEDDYSNEPTPLAIEKRDGDSKRDGEMKDEAKKKEGKIQKGSQLRHVADCWKWLAKVGDIVEISFARRMVEKGARLLEEKENQKRKKKMEKEEEEKKKKTGENGDIKDRKEEHKSKNGEKEGGGSEKKETDSKEKATGKAKASEDAERKEEILDEKDENAGKGIAEEGTQKTDKMTDKMTDEKESKAVEKSGSAEKPSSSAQPSSKSSTAPEEKISKQKGRREKKESIDSKLRALQQTVKAHSNELTSELVEDAWKEIYENDQAAKATLCVIVSKGKSINVRRLSLRKSFIAAKWRYPMMQVVASDLSRKIASREKEQEMSYLEAFWDSITTTEAFGVRFWKHFVVQALWAVLSQPVFNVHVVHASSPGSVSIAATTKQLLGGGSPFGSEQWRQGWWKIATTGLKPRVVGFCLSLVCSALYFEMGVKSHALFTVLTNGKEITFLKAMTGLQKLGIDFPRFLLNHLVNSAVSQMALGLIGANRVPVDGMGVVDITKEIVISRNKIAPPKNSQVSFSALLGSMASFLQGQPYRMNLIYPDDSAPAHAGNVFSLLYPLRAMFVNHVVNVPISSNTEAQTAGNMLLRKSGWLTMWRGYALEQLSGMLWHGCYFVVDSVWEKALLRYKKLTPRQRLSVRRVAGISTFVLTGSTILLVLSRASLAHDRGPGGRAKNEQ